jgi:hypothetical protein
MDSIFEYVIILSIIWSFISSYISKKKKAAAQADQTRVSENESEFNSELINDLSNLLKSKSTDVKIDSPTTPMHAFTQKKEKREFVKREFKSDIKKRASKNTRLKNISIESTEDSFLHHTQHVLDEIQVDKDIRCHC